MLPAYALHAAWLGLVYVVDFQGRQSLAPGLEFARLLLPLSAWGALFLTLSALIAAALWSDRTTLLRAALLTYGTVMVGWALVYAISIALNPAASLGAPAHPLLVAAACKATERSIRNQGR